MDVWESAVQRMSTLYAGGHRLVISFSGGKDSTVTLAVAVEAAKRTGRLPVDVVVRDEEICYPGSYEFIERTHDRPDVNLRWLNQQQPVINIFNRKNPYFWVFDDRLDPEQWVRIPPPYTEKTPERSIEYMTNPTRFPPAEGKTLFAVIGLRAQESRGRMYGVYSAGGHLTQANKMGVRNCRPIYDWSDGDVWKCIKDFGLDYNGAYDVFHRFGVKRSALRIGPPTMTVAAVRHLEIARQAWPQWFDKVCQRLEGIRTASMFGVRAVQPMRRNGESWEACYKRTCIDEAPPWIAERSTSLMRLAGRHGVHSTQPFPEVAPCYTCFGNIGSWKALAGVAYNGDPFVMKTGALLPLIEPEFFREGAGTWGGTPTF